FGERAGRAAGSTATRSGGLLTGVGGTGVSGRIPVSITPSLRRHEVSSRLERSSHGARWLFSRTGLCVDFSDRDNYAQDDMNFRGGEVFLLTRFLFLLLGLRLLMPHGVCVCHLLDHRQPRSAESEAP